MTKSNRAGIVVGMEHPLLFPELPELLSPARIRQTGDEPVWTENKAQLVARYLYYFAFITRHGAYIDGFAGPKRPDHPSSWAAKLVMENEPRRLREFFLCEIKARKVGYLRELIGQQPRDPGRTIELHEGDFNRSIHEILASGGITDKKATFCLVDQFTCQCRWDTLKALARHKAPGSRKIELFYFLATGWLKRALPAFTRNTHVPEAWWGREDWRSLVDLGPYSLMEAFRVRFEKELGYRYVAGWPIYQRQRQRGKIMFFMIHASDHPEAPKQMNRAYRNIMKPRESEEQMLLEFPELAE